jgi:hypothetical protein
VRGIMRCGHLTAAENIYADHEQQSSDPSRSSALFSHCGSAQAEAARRRAGGGLGHSECRSNVRCPSLQFGDFFAKNEARLIWAKDTS